MIAAILVPARRLPSARVAAARSAGAALELLFALPPLAQAEIFGGRWAAAVATAGEAVRLARETGQPELSALPMAWLTGRLRRGEPAILEAAGFVFLCGGLATLLDVSYLLACIVLGAVVANRAKHHTRPFHAIEGAADPFLSFFLV